MTVLNEDDLHGYYTEKGTYIPVCSADPEYFYADGNTDTSVQKAYCASCPIQKQCLEDALEAEGGIHVDHRFGISGGLDPKERFKLAKKLGIKGQQRGYPSLFCAAGGHLRSLFYDRSMNGCHACRNIKDGNVVETRHEQQERLAHKEFSGTLHRVKRTAMTGKYAPKRGMGGFTRSNLPEE